MPVASPKPQTAKPQVRLLDLAGGPWMSLGHKLQPPSLPSRFSQPKYTSAEQAEAPDQPRTRVVKDVLKVGKWKGEVDEKTGKRLMWDVSRETLLQIASDFQLAQSRGLAANLTLSHGDPSTLMVPTADLIAPIDEVVVEGDVLWASAYVTPQQSKFLQNTAMKVSPGVVTHWTDGAGNLYRERLLHIAVVDNPVVMGQGPFRLLANDLPGGGEMDFATILDQFVRLFALLGYTMNTDGVDESNLSATVETLLGDAESSEESDEGGEADPAEGAEIDAGMAEDEVPAMLTNADISKVKSPLLRTLLLQNAAIMKRLGDQDQKDFEASVDRLKKNGMPEASAVMLLSNGKAKGWDRSMLAPLEAAFPEGSAKKGPELGRKARVLANGSAPKLSAAKVDEDHDSALAMLMNGRQFRKGHGPQKKS